MISIPNPCPKKWNEMIPVAGENYCSACEKVVVDLSECSNEEILDRLKVNGRTCGRMTVAQLMPVKQKYKLSKFLAALLLVFSFGLFSCGRNNEQEHVVGDVAPVKDSMVPQLNNDSATNANKLKPETPFRLSPADSTKVADSVERNKNHVRDFE